MGSREPIAAPTAGPTTPVKRAAVGLGGVLKLAVSSSWLIIALLAVWEIWARVQPSPFIPPMSTILRTLWSNFFSSDPRRLFTSDLFSSDLLVSLGRVGIGWGVSAAVGIAVGILMGISVPVGHFLGPLVRFALAIPATALLPITLVLFGITSQMNISLVVLGTIWIIILNTMDGVRSIDPVIRTSARSMRLGPARFFSKVVLPGASPQIVTGLRVSLGVALVLMVVSELFAATSGIGFYVILSSRQFRFPDMWSGVVLIAIVGIIINIVFAIIEARVMRWHLASTANVLQ